MKQLKFSAGFVSDGYNHLTVASKAFGEPVFKGMISDLQVTDSAKFVEINLKVSFTSKPWEYGWIANRSNMNSFHWLNVQATGWSYDKDLEMPVVQTVLQQASSPFKVCSSRRSSGKFRLQVHEISSDDYLDQDPWSMDFSVDLTFNSGKLPSPSTPTRVRPSTYHSLQSQKSTRWNMEDTDTSIDPSSLFDIFNDEELESEEAEEAELAIVTPRIEDLRNPGEDQDEDQSGRATTLTYSDEQEDLSSDVSMNDESEEEMHNLEYRDSNELKRCTCFAHMQGAYHPMSHLSIPYHLNPSYHSRGLAQMCYPLPPFLGQYFPPPLMSVPFVPAYPQELPAVWNNTKNAYATDPANMKGKKEEFKFL